MSKLKIEVDMSDVLLEIHEEGEWNLQELFKDAIKSEISAEMRKIVNKTITDEIRNYVSNDLAQEIKTEMRVYLREFLTTKQLPDHYENKTVEKYLCDIFGGMIHKSTILDEIRSLATKWGAETKKQYDGVFASKVVESLHAHGLLLPNAAQFLLEKD